MSEQALPGAESAHPESFISHDHIAAGARGVNAVASGSESPGRVLISAYSATAYSDDGTGLTRRAEPGNDRNTKNTGRILDSDISVTSRVSMHPAGQVAVSKSEHFKPEIEEKSAQNDQKGLAYRDGDSMAMPLQLNRAVGPVQGQALVSGILLQGSAFLGTGDSTRTATAYYLGPNKREKSASRGQSRWLSISFPLHSLFTGSIPSVAVSCLPSYPIISGLCSELPEEPMSDIAVESRPVEKENIGQRSGHSSPRLALSGLLSKAKGLKFQVIQLQTQSRQKIEFHLFRSMRNELHGDPGPENMAFRSQVRYTIGPVLVKERTSFEREEAGHNGKRESRNSEIACSNEKDIYRGKRPGNLSTTGESRHNRERRSTT